MAIINDDEFKEDVITTMENYIQRPLTPRELKVFVSDEELEHLQNKMFETQSELIADMAQKIINLTPEPQ